MAQRPSNQQEQERIENDSVVLGSEIQQDIEFDGLTSEHVSRAGVNAQIHNSIVQRQNKLPTITDPALMASKDFQNNNVAHHYQSVKDLASSQQHESLKNNLPISMSQQDVRMSQGDPLTQTQLEKHINEQLNRPAPTLGQASPSYNFRDTSKQKTIGAHHTYLSSFGPRTNPFPSRNINAIVPSYQINRIKNYKQSNEKKFKLRSKQAEALIQMHQKDLLEIRLQLIQRQGKLKKLGIELNQNGGDDQDCRDCLLKSFRCLSWCMKSLNQERPTTVSLKIETITCNKLSHCLFDFDCPDFNAQYENEKYEHQIFKQKNLVSRPREPTMLTLLDQQFLREDMKVSMRDVLFEKDNYGKIDRNEKDHMLVELPYARQKEADKQNFVFRILFKPDTGDLWGFNDFECNKELFEEEDYLPLMTSNAQSQAHKTAADKNNNEVSATLDDIGMNETANDAATNRLDVHPKSTLAANQSSCDHLHSRLNILDDQVTINYNLSQPTLFNRNAEDDDEDGKSKKKKRLSKKQLFAKTHNYRELTQEQMDKEIEFENNVDLDKTMWLVMRDKRSVNNILRRFETRDSFHLLKVNDIVKFGRVNFKVSIIKSDKLTQDIQGGYDLLEKKNQQIEDALAKLQDLKTQQDTQMDPIARKNKKNKGKIIGSDFGKNIYDDELVNSRQQALVTGSHKAQLQKPGMFEIPTNSQLNRDATRDGDITHQSDRQATQENMPAADRGLNSSIMPLNQPYSRNDNLSAINRTGFGFDQNDESNIQIVASQVSLDDEIGVSNQKTRSNWMQKKSGKGQGLHNNFLHIEDTSIKSSQSHMSRSAQSSVQYKVDGEIPVCRICLGTEEEGVASPEGKPDKLICPCKCAGSMGMIHISCLKEWVNGKRLVYKGKKVQSFFWKTLECELCNEAFENRMKYRMFQIMKIDLPNEGNDYMIFESIKSAPAKVIHVFDLSKCTSEIDEDEECPKHNEFRVGRSVDTDMRIADISVSRVHSFIRIVGNEVILSDNGSKFGTLVKIFKPTQLVQLKNKEGDEFPKGYKYNASIYQIGKTMFYFKFYDINQRNLQKNQIQEVSFRKDTWMDPNDSRLAYIPWKGTHLCRKTMHSSEIKLVPREFVNNVFSLGKGTINKIGKTGGHAENIVISDQDQEEDVNERAPSANMSRTNTHRNSEDDARDKSMNIITDQEPIHMEGQLADKIIESYVKESYLGDHGGNNQEDIIKGLGLAQGTANRRGSPFKTQLMNIQQEQDNDAEQMIFEEMKHMSLEDQETPVNILKGVQKIQQIQGQQEYFSNQSFNPNQGVRDSVNNTHPQDENIQSSHRDFNSTYSQQARKISQVGSAQNSVQSPSQRLSKNVHHIEIKNKIARINELSGSDDSEDERLVSEHLQNQKKDIQMIMVKQNKRRQTEDHTNSNTASKIPMSGIMDKLADNDKHIVKAYQSANHKQSLSEDQDINRSSRVLEIKDEESQKMINTINNKQFLSINDVHQDGKDDAIDSQIQNYSSQLDERHVKLSQKDKNSPDKKSNMTNLNKNTFNSFVNFNSNEYGSGPLNPVLEDKSVHSATFGQYQKTIMNTKDGEVNKTGGEQLQVKMAHYGSSVEVKGKQLPSETKTSVLVENYIDNDSLRQQLQVNKSITEPANQNSSENPKEDKNDDNN